MVIQRKEKESKGKESIVHNSTTLSTKEIFSYVAMLEDLHEKKYESYIDMSLDLLFEFGIKITKEQLIKMFEDPEIEECMIDAQLIYKNMT